MGIGIIVLARLSSSRVPGKALIDVGGKPLVKHVLDRLSLRFDKRMIILATSIEESDDRLAEYVRSLGYSVFRGSLENVAERFMNAALAHNFETAVRVTGDSLFTDPEIIASLLKIYTGDDYVIVSNRKFKTYPIGQTFEVVSMIKYAEIYKNFRDKDDFEHVTKYIYDNEDLLNLKLFHLINPDGVLRDHSLAIDTAEDLSKFDSLLMTNPEFAFESYKKIYYFL